MTAQRGQSVVEYLLVLACVICAVLAAVKPGGVFSTSTANLMNESGQTIGKSLDASKRQLGLQ